MERYSLEPGGAESPRGCPFLPNDPWHHTDGSSRSSLAVQAVLIVP